jgi:protein-S-isoprenylcysteine O-methyltransferase Ste14
MTVVSGRRRRPPVARQLRNVPLPEPHLVGIAGWVGMQWLQPRPLPGPRLVHHLAGWALLAAGGHLVARSLRAASRVDLAQPARLVTTGVYATSRNPMYVGWAMLDLGAGLVGGSAWVLGTFPATTWLVHRQVPREERDLGEVFRDEFARYRASVPRYLPIRQRRRNRRRRFGQWVAWVTAPRR